MIKNFLMETKELGPGAMITIIRWQRRKRNIIYDVDYVLPMEYFDDSHQI